MAAAPPLNDTIAAAVAQLVDDSKSSERRHPSHSDIDHCVGLAGLGRFDPKRQGQPVGKAKRVRAVLFAALEEDQEAGARLIESLLAQVRASGGFRAASANFVGAEAIANAKEAFGAMGFSLADDGALAPKVLASLAGAEMTAALAAYAGRAQRGAEDAALLSGSGKDLLEATAAHVLQTVNGSYPASANFHGLLGMAYVSLGLATPEMPPTADESPIKALERALFSSAIAVNRLRNKEGTGHGRPWLPSVSDFEAKASVETAGCVAAYLLAKLAKRRP